MLIDYERITTNIFSNLQDLNLKSFDIIFKPEGSNTSPVICIDHHLGIESWCLKDLFLYAYNIVFKHTSDSCNYDASLLTILLLNPDIKTLWNKRRLLILDKKAQLDFELNFVRLVLSFKPKSQDALNYRKWLLREFKEKLELEFLEKEFKLILDAASQHTNNHVAWDYGIWLLNSTNEEILPSILVKFWNYSANWIKNNVSDYSGLHFRQFLVNKLISDDIIPLIDHSFKKQIMLTGLEFLGSVFKISDENFVIECCQKFETEEYSSFYIVGILLADFELNDSLISFYSDHEALWNHRRFLCYYFLTFIPRVIPTESKKLFSALVKRILTMSANFSDVNESNLFDLLFLKIHYNFLDKCESGDSQCYSKKYIDWLKKSKMLIS